MLTPDGRKIPSVHPYTPESWYGYFENLTLTFDGRLACQDSGLPICMEKEWPRFHRHATKALQDGAVSKNMLIDDFVNAVQAIAGEAYLDARIFADYFITGHKLGNPMDFGLLTLDSWY
ncbi:hypothetical protein V5O48_016424 [Marasmius crinis-equi]|uniref:Uncharacterized protein n=1 Tax=Marasmius crinis-equi TaxID=585013 RepID=A0ABR3ERW9_9AGAR